MAIAAPSLHSGRLQRDDSDLWRAIEAEGKAYCADAAVHVKLKLVEAEVALDVLLSEGREDERADEGESYLAAVGVTCEHQVDEWAAGMLHDVVGVVGFVRHEDDRAIGLFGYGEVEIGMAGVRVIRAAEPDAGVVAFDRDILID